MSENIFDITMVEVPTLLPVLPFSGTFLFPEMKVNLRIYEMRYIRLVFNALATSRIIGVVQPTEQDMPMKNPPLYKVGCAGRITSFSEADNLLNITLTGICRFKVVNVKNHMGNIYMHADVDYSDYESDYNPPELDFDKQKLFAKLDFYAYSNKLDINSSVLKETPDRLLPMTLASMLPFEPPEKQALLECSSSEKFLETLMMLLDMNSDARLKGN